MSKHSFSHTAPAPLLIPAGQDGRTVLATALGALGGMIAGTLVYSSPVVGLFAAAGGAVFGAISAVSRAEPQGRAS
jgi:hypothetical protein